MSQSGLPAGCLLILQVPCQNEDYRINAPLNHVVSELTKHHFTDDRVIVIREAYTTDNLHPYQLCLSTVCKMRPVAARTNRCNGFMYTSHSKHGIHNSIASAINQNIHWNSPTIKSWIAHYLQCFIWKNKHFYFDNTDNKPCIIYYNWWDFLQFHIAKKWK